MPFVVHFWYQLVSFRYETQTVAVFKQCFYSDEFYFAKHKPISPVTTSKLNNSTTFSLSWTHIVRQEEIERMKGLLKAEIIKRRQKYEKRFGGPRTKL